jgi:transcription initiation factor TFIIIB Brf1 subunit/transcription initiation factor TFIIB
MAAGEATSVPALDADRFCDCSKPDIIEDEGVFVCRLCGVMGSQVLDDTPEWRHFSEDKGRADPARCGNPVSDLLPQSSCSVIVKTTGASGEGSKDLARSFQRQTGSSKEAALVRVFAYIASVCEVHGLPRSIIEEAKRFYVQQSQQTVVRGSNRDGMIASSVFHACSQHDYSVTVEEVNSWFHFNLSHTSKGCTKASNIISESGVKLATAAQTPFTFMYQFCGKLGIDGDAQCVCAFVAFRWMKLKKDLEHSPASIAAALLQLTAERCAIPISAAAVESASGVSFVSIIKCKKRIERLIDVDNDLLKGAPGGVPLPQTPSRTK